VPYAGVTARAAKCIIFTKPRVLRALPRSASSAMPRAAQHVVAGFRQGLKEAGYIEGQNVAIEFRSADGRLDRLSALVADLIHHPVEMIVGNSVSAKAAKAATTTVPIIEVGTAAISELSRRGLPQAELQSRAKVAWTPGSGGKSGAVVAMAWIPGFSS
jgi:ABC transporter substrate binding protein